MRLQGLLLGLLSPCLVLAQEPLRDGQDEIPLAGEPAIIDMAPVAVSGRQPGPGMWRVVNGDNVLWILGVTTPLPRDIEWKSDDVEAVLWHADAVLGMPGVVVDADIGFFGKLMLAPSALKAARNPGDAMLQDVLPADVYARWRMLKPRYLGNDRSIEKKRPIVAAGELYAAAMEQAGLGTRPVVTPVLDRVMKRRKLDYTKTSLQIHIDDPKAAVAEFRNERLEDVQCLSGVMTAVERDIPLMTARANAWSLGDVDALRAMPYRNPQWACLSAFSHSAAARNRGYDDVEVRIKAQWLKVADAALGKQRITLALLPVDLLLAPDGYLAALRGKGYQIIEP